MCFKHKADNLTSTSKSGLRILSRPKHFLFGKLFISFVRPSVVFSIGPASFGSSLWVSEICRPSQNWFLNYLFSISAHCDISIIVSPCGLTSIIGESLLGLVVGPNISQINLVFGDATTNGCSIYYQIERTGECNRGVLWTWSTVSQKEMQKSQIISSDENFPGCRATLDTIGKITGDRQKVTMTTRSAASGEMTSVYVASHVYHGTSSFLPRTIRDTRGNIN